MPQQKLEWQSYQDNVAKIQTTSSALDWAAIEELQRQSYWDNIFKEQVFCYATMKIYNGKVTRTMLLRIQAIGSTLRHAKNKKLQWQSYQDNVTEDSGYKFGTLLCNTKKLKWQATRTMYLRRQTTGSTHFCAAVKKLLLQHYQDRATWKAC